MSNRDHYPNSDWNDSRQQDLEYAEYSAKLPSDPYDRIPNHSQEHSDRGYEQAPASISRPRFGRPPASNFNAEFDYDSRQALQRNDDARSRSKSPIVPHVLGVDSSRDGSMNERYFERGTNHGRNSNASGNMWSDQVHNSNHVDRFSDNSGLAAAAAVGVGVGISTSDLSPYPSLNTNRSSVASYPSGTQPGAVASSSASKLSRTLPPKKEATPTMPPSLAVEPTMPAPRVSRRYVHYTRLPRQPDLAVAKKVKNARYKPGDEDKQVLKCPNCQSFLKIPKLAVLMRCPTCSTVSPTASSSGSSAS